MKPKNRKQLAAWLQKQATKLKSLTTRGWKLQSACLTNARAKGKVLARVHTRLQKTDISFDDWVTENTDIGVSTAYLYMDVAEWWDDLQALWKDSNGLETILRQARDQIRDLKQSRGLGKPGSGRKPVTEAAVTSSSKKPVAATEALRTSTTENELAIWERAIREAAEQNSGGKRKTAVKEKQYEVMAISSDVSDLDSIKKLLHNPIIRLANGQVSVKACVEKDQIDVLMAEVGLALKENPPKELRLLSPTKVKSAWIMWPHKMKYEATWKSARTGATADPCRATC